MLLPEWDAYGEIDGPEERELFAAAEASLAPGALARLGEAIEAAVAVHGALSTEIPLPRQCDVRYNQKNMSCQHLYSYRGPGRKAPSSLGSRRSVGAMAVVAVVALGGLITGCGGGGEPKPFNADRLVLKARELPTVRKAEAPLPEPCGPLAELEEHGGEAALSPRFVLKRGEAVEAAAIFPGENPARSVFRTLDNPRRLRCIAASIASYIGQANVAFKLPRPVNLGDEAVVALYRVLAPSSGLTRYADIVVLRVGRCTASILISARGEATASRLASSASHTAADLLSDPCR